MPPVIKSGPINNSEYRKLYRSANKEKIAASKKAWKAMNKDKIADHNRTYQAVNKEKVLLYSKNYYIVNKERLNKKSIEWVVNNKEKRISYLKEYNKNNKELISKGNKKYRDNNKESIAVMQKVWRKANQNKKNMHGAKRRAAKLHRTVKWANDFFIEEIYSLAKLRTKMLGIEFHVDHIIPLQGELVSGLHVENNLQIITASENCAKGNRF